MAYSTGSASTLIGLLDALRAALLAEGWTIHRWDDTWLAAQPAGGPLVFHWVISSTSDANYPQPRLYLNGSTSYDAGAAWNAQPGQTGTTVDTFSESWLAPFGVYHLFIGTDYAHLVARADDGMWRHALVGMMEAASTAAAGYLQHVKWYRAHALRTHDPSSAYHGYPWGSPGISTVVGRYAWIWMSGVGWQHINTIFSETYALPVFRFGESENQNVCLYQRLMIRGANEFNALTPLIPLAAAPEVSGGGAYHLAGHAKDARLVRMDYLQAGDLITIGSEEWLAFPAINRGYPPSGSLIPGSGMIGYAYRRSIP